MAGEHLDTGELDSIGHEAVCSGMSALPSGPRARPSIC
jgi:hypothetical protein